MIKFSIMITGMYPMKNYVDWARRIEALGFDEIHIADDLIMRPAWPILTLIGAHTSRIKLGPAIITPQVAHPAYHAGNLAALDELTSGRAICGLGRGGFNEMIGLPRGPKPIKQVKEAYLLLRHLLTGNREPFSGEFYNTTADLFFQFDVLRPDMSIFIGTWGPQMARMAGTIASGIKADCTWRPSYVRHLREQVTQGAESVGRSPEDLEIIVGPLCSVAKSRDRARDHIREMLALLLPLLAPMTDHAGISQQECQAIHDTFAAGDTEKAKAMVPESALRAFSASGTPADIIPEIEEIIESGATHIAFGPPLGPDFDEALELLGTEVLPYFKQRYH